MYCILRTERKETRSEKIEVKWKEKKRKVDKVWWDRESHILFVFGGHHQLLSIFL